MSSKYDYNRQKPMMMHIDLNSAFATIEQQSRPLLRGKPIAVVNRRVKHTGIVTASYEAKAMGVKVGMKFDEAKRLCPKLIPIESDPAKYRYVFRKLTNILKSYSPDVVMKSIDEGVINFSSLVNQRDLVEIGQEIKARLRSEIGLAMRCNVGIGTSRFLAKTAAGLHKPDGLDVINYENLRQVYQTMKLTDITGIAGNLERRLNSVGIYTPVEFLDADIISLEKIVFKSVVGRDWYHRLRGYEVDNRVSKTKTVGRQYVLENRELSRIAIASRLHNLCESVGSRMRSGGYMARGVYIYVKTVERKYWHSCMMSELPFYSDKTINHLAQKLFMKAPNNIIEIGVRCYNLTDQEVTQMSLFADEMIREGNLITAIDNINARFGDRTIHSADTLNLGSFINPKIPFGSTRYL